jgi:hypothetical protein
MNTKNVFRITLLTVAVIVLAASEARAQPAGDCGHGSNLGTFCLRPPAPVVDCRSRYIRFGEVSAATLRCNADDLAVKREWAALKKAGCSAPEATIQELMGMGSKRAHALAKAKGWAFVCGRPTR